MSLVALIPVCALVSFAAVYAHLMLRAQSASAASARFTRVVLIAVAVAFGYVTAVAYHESLPVQILIGLTSFGVVHVPAACILYLKRLRAEQDHNAR